MRRKVHIETTVPSFYAETREDAAAVYGREATRRWRAEHRDRVVGPVR
jgi:hypothetical protein